MDQRYQPQPDQARIREFATLLMPQLATDLVNLLNLKATQLSIEPGKEIVTKGKPCTAIFLITKGVAIRYRPLDNGQRIILKLLLPGDFAGLTSCHFSTAQFSVKTLMPSVVHRISVSYLTDLSKNNPQLAARLSWSSAAETAMLAEHLINVGRRSALERVAHFLLELLMRLQHLGLTNGNMFWFPFTQEIIADALGLSAPHVSRILQKLQEEELIHIKNKRIQIKNVEELTELADFTENYLRLRPIAEINQTV
jgi:CRP-like cAMP-binding protein